MGSWLNRLNWFAPDFSPELATLVLWLPWVLLCRGWAKRYAVGWGLTPNRAYAALVLFGVLPLWSGLVVLSWCFA